MTVNVTLASEAETERLAAWLSSNLPRRCLVALEGTLGAGKTRLVRAFAEACGVPAAQVTSPTFTLWQTYEADRVVHHLDAYRIQDEDEFDALGVAECFDTDAVTFVEWANRVAGCLPESARLTIRIEVLSEAARRAELISNDARINELLEKLPKSFVR